MSGALHLSGTLTCTPEDLDAVLAALPEHIRLSRAEPGCLSFEVAQSAADPCVLEVSESFRNRAAFEAHQTRTRASAWWRVTAHVQRAFTVSCG
ncbi:MAG: putative quinol monooxygenase [Paracoccaceae bacterium]